MNTSNQDLKLSINAMPELFGLNSSEKKTYDVNLDLQVMHIKKIDQNRKGGNTEMCTATLSDSIFKYNGFIVIRDVDAEAIDEKDILRILNVQPAIISNQKSRVFVVKKYELLAKGVELFGDPENVKDEPGVFSNLDSNENNNGYENRKNKNKNFQNNIDMNDDNSNYYKNAGLTSIPTLNGNHQNGVKIEDHDDDEEQGISKRKLGKFYTPLKQLTTFSKDFQILVRVIKKNDMKTFNSSPNKTGGQLFSFVILDEEGHEMQVTCFNKACSKFYNQIGENKIFEITGGYVKINEKKFTSVKSDYKIVIDENSQVVEKEDDGLIKHQNFNFLKIDKVPLAPLYSVVDCIGYILEVSEKVVKNTKNGEQPMKKIIIADESETKIEFTLWRNFAHTEVYPGQVLALKNVKVGEFNGRNISTFEESIVLIDPLMKEATELRVFMGDHKNTESFRNLSIPGLSNNSNGDQYVPPVFFMRDILDTLDDVIADDKLPMSRIKATVTQMMHNDKNLYAGCSDLHCKKKLQQDTYTWACIPCNKTYTKPTYYYTLSIRVKDCSSEHWIDIFGGVAERLMKIPAEEYKDILAERDNSKLKEITNSIEFKTFYFHVKPKLHYYNAVPKKKIYAYKIENVEIIADSRRLLKALSSQLKN